MLRWVRMQRPVTSEGRKSDQGLGMESVGDGRSGALCGCPLGKLGGWTSGDYLGSQGQVQEEGCDRIFKPQTLPPPTSTFFFFFRLRTALVRVTFSSISHFDFSYFRFGPSSVAIFFGKLLSPAPPSECTQPIHPSNSYFALYGLRGFAEFNFPLHPEARWEAQSFIFAAPLLVELLRK